MTALRLGVNVDHVATVRNARGGAVPDPVRAALLAIEAGADGITAHLREDRRHILDDDMRRLKASIAQAAQFRDGRDRGHARHCAQDPSARLSASCRKSGRNAPPKAVSTWSADSRHLKPFVAELTREGIRVSMFIEPSPEALKASAELGAPVVELHTGAWCDARARGEAAKADHEFGRLQRGAAQSRRRSGSSVMPATASTTTPRASSPPCRRSSNSTSAISSSARRSFVGLAETVKAMRMAMNEGARPRSAGFDHRHRQRPLRHRAHRDDARALRRALHRPLLHRDRAAPLGSTRRARGLLRQAIRRQGGLRQGARHRLEARRVLARHGGGQSSVRAADHELTGGAAERLKAMPPDGAAFIHLTITDEGPYAQAFVVIEARSSSWGISSPFACECRGSNHLFQGVTERSATPRPDTLQASAR